MASIVLKLSLALCLCLALLTPAGAQDDPLAADWKQVLAKAKGSTVYFCGFGGWAHVNQWIDGYVAQRMAELYGIKVERRPMDAAVFVNKLLTEKAAGLKDGSIDLLWINGENFKKTAEAGCLWGDFASRLPNFQAYVDPATASHDFGYPVEGRESPYGRAQFVLEYDPGRTPNPPRSFAALLAWAKEHPGRLTYPQPPDFTGSAFIRMAFYELTGGHAQYMKGWDPKLFAAQAPKLWDYLNQLKPYLWQEGRAYPQDSAALDTLFARGEVDLGMSYHPPHAQTMILQGIYPDTVRTLVMDHNSIYNTHFVTIPANAPHKAAAMVLANFLLSPEAQLSKFEPGNWGDFPVLDMGKLPQEWQKKFAAVDLGPATLSPAQLAPHGVPEIPAAYLEALEAGWDEHVLR